MEQAKHVFQDIFLAIFALIFPFINELLIATTVSFSLIHQVLTETKEFLNVIVVLLVITKFLIEIYKLLKEK